MRQQQGTKQHRADDRFQSVHYCIRDQAQEREQESQQTFEG